MSSEPTLPLEVELKYRVDDREALLAVIEKIDGMLQTTVEQVDLYFAHPQRDFAETDEALRIRKITDLDSGNRSSRVTYKGPKLPGEGKTRQELEFALPADDQQPAAMQQMLSLLSFREVREVIKQRTVYTVQVEGSNQQAEIAVDQVEGLGLYVEIELQAKQQTLAAASEAIARIAQQLGLSQPERRSYLELLLDC